MAQKYIEGDVVMYDNKIMVVKEPRDGSHFDLSCHKEGLVYCFVSVEDMKPVPLTPEILKKNGWKTFIELHDFRYAFKIDDLCYLVVMTGFLDGIRIFIRKGTIYSKLRTLKYVSDLQHLLFGLGLNSEMEV